MVVWTPSYLYNDTIHRKEAEPCSVEARMTSKSDQLERTCLFKSVAIPLWCVGTNTECCPLSLQLQDQW